LELPHNTERKKKVEAQKAARKLGKNGQIEPSERTVDKHKALNATIVNSDPPGCAKPEPPDPNATTAFLDSAASASILGKDAACAIEKIQDSNFILNTPSHVPIFTSKTLELLLNRLPQAARKAFRVDNIPHNLVAVATLVDAGCSVHFYYWGFDIDYNGETI
jgi:hypothetical protein